MAHIEDRWERTVDGKKVKSRRHGIAKRWRARYLDPDGRERSQTFERRIDAERFLAAIEGDKVHGTYIDPSAGDITVRAFAAEWLAAQHLADTTRISYAGHLDRDILDRFGDIPLRLIRPTAVQGWVSSLAAEPRNLSPATATAVFRVFAILMRAAVRDQLIARSPCEGVRTPTVRDRELEPEDLLTRDQVFAWDAAMPELYRGAVLVAAATGLRQGELLGLRIDGPDPDRAGRALRRVDLLRKEIRVVEQIQTPPGGEPYYCSPKTAKGFRRIPIEGIAVAAIAAHLERQPTLDGEPIFRTKEGRRFRRQRFREVWAAAAKAAELPAGTHWHQLRDYYASALIAGGCDVKVVMERLGHASAEETLRTYARLWPDSDDRTRAAVTRALTVEPTTADDEARSHAR